MSRRVQIKSPDDIKRLPDDTVYCGRPTEYGNPFKPADYIEPVKRMTGAGEHETVLVSQSIVRLLARLYCVADYKDWLDKRPDLKERMRQELRGKNLACYCALDQICHCDIILREANSDATII